MFFYEGPTYLYLLIFLQEKDAQSAPGGPGRRRARLPTVPILANATVRGTHTIPHIRRVKLSILNIYLYLQINLLQVALYRLVILCFITFYKSAISASGIGKKKKRKARQAAVRSETPPGDTDPIDPDEPRYCLCDQISFGEMILCDNDLCPIEWFHFSCVSLTTKPKGKWFCPKCRGDRPNVMKPKGQFLKELERYNREKEEKA